MSGIWSPTGTVAQSDLDCAPGVVCINGECKPMDEPWVITFHEIGKGPDSFYAYAKKRLESIIKEREDYLLYGKSTKAQKEYEADLAVVYGKTSKLEE